MITFQMDANTDLLQVKYNLISYLNILKCLNPDTRANYLKTTGSVPMDFGPSTRCFDSTLNYKAGSIFFDTLK